jgi:hypothetical protein
LKLNGLPSILKKAMESIKPALERVMPTSAVGIRHKIELERRNRVAALAAASYE